MRNTLLSLLMLCSAIFVHAQSQNALDFDGIDDEILVPGASSLIAGSNQFSLTCWVYPTNANPMYPDFDGFAGFRNEIDCDFYVMQISPSTAIEARFRNSSGAFFTITSQTLTLNTWQHLAVTFDGTMLRLFVGGAVVDSVAASGGITNLAESFHIGSLPYQANPYWLTGKTDEISLWNRALTPIEITCISQESVDANDPGCMLFYTCNQGTANGDNTAIPSLEDESGHMDGHFTNMTLNGTFSNFVAGVNNASSVAHTICQGDSYQFGNELVNTAGYYYETFPMSGACGNLQELNLVVIPVDTSVTQAGEVLTANAAGAVYQWVDCNNGYAAIPGEIGQTFSPAVDGSYALIVTSGGCSDTSSCYSVTNVSILENELAALKLFPNPATDFVTIQHEGVDQDIFLEITDATGKIISNSRFAASAQINFNVSGWSAGIYFVKLTAGMQAAHLKLIKIAAGN